jgi:hypothetical protein
VLASSANVMLISHADHPRTVVVRGTSFTLPRYGVVFASLP